MNVCPTSDGVSQNEKILPKTSRSSSFFLVHIMPGGLQHSIPIYGNTKSSSRSCCNNVPAAVLHRRLFSWIGCKPLNRAGGDTSRIRVGWAEPPVIIPAAEGCSPGPNVVS
ncbi:hypothetical protein JTB14_008102 [Gonioctena quinquepunctata]|nr:hypothetical protein JTB14_008102 [Gonioctena quinquepunctata]